WPSSNRIAANTEPPSCTRAARFVGCGWGKWVIADKDYDVWAMLQEDYDRPSPDVPFPSPSKIPRSPCTTAGCAYCPPRHWPKGLAAMDRNSLLTAPCLNAGFPPESPFPSSV